MRNYVLRLRRTMRNYVLRLLRTMNILPCSRESINMCLALPLRCRACAAAPGDGPHPTRQWPR